METAIPLVIQTGVDFPIENRIKRFLSAIGWQEVYTYSMVSQEIALHSGFKLNQHLKLQNPLTDDRIYLRQSLLPSLEEVLDSNPHQPELSVFEIANLYQPQEKNIPLELLSLSLASGQSYRVVKGYVETLLDQFYVTNYDFMPQQQPAPIFVQAANIIADEHVIGTIGVLQSGRVGVDIAMTQLLLVAQTHPSYQPIPKTAALLEDMTFTLPEQTLVGEVIKTIRQASELIYAVKLKDTYQQNFTFQVTYLDPSRNLSTQDIRPVREQLVRQLAKDYQAELVGAV
jgi:phenylalanyl-tRNA synthetase beta chain